MGDKDNKDVKVDGSVTMETVKVMGESIGIGNMPDGASECLSSDVTYRVKQIIQVSIFVFKVALLQMVVFLAGGPEVHASC